MWESVKDYFDFNKGAIDILVVEDDKGNLASTPFHVRFGRKAISDEETVVNITVNGKPVDLHMKLGELGEAYFEEKEDISSKEEVPEKETTENEKANSEQHDKQILALPAKEKESRPNRWNWGWGGMPEKSAGSVGSLSDSEDHPTLDKTIEPVKEEVPEKLKESPTKQIPKPTPEIAVPKKLEREQQAPKVTSSWTNLFNLFKKIETEPVYMIKPLDMSKLDWSSEEENIEEGFYSAARSPRDYRSPPSNDCLIPRIDSVGEDLYLLSEPVTPRISDEEASDGPCLEDIEIHDHYDDNNHIDTSDHSINNNDDNKTTQNNTTNHIEDNFDKNTASLHESTFFDQPTNTSHEHNNVVVKHKINEENNIIQNSEHNNHIADDHTNTEKPKGKHKTKHTKREKQDKNKNRNKQRKRKNSKDKNTENNKVVNNTNLKETPKQENTETEHVHNNIAESVSEGPGSKKQKLRITWKESEKKKSGENGEVHPKGEESDDEGNSETKKRVKGRKLEHVNSWAHSPRKGISFSPSVENLSAMAASITSLDDLDVEMSFSRNLIETARSTADQNTIDEIFQEHKISYEQFLENPGDVLTDPSVVFKIQGNIYPTSIAAPVLLSYLVFHKPLPQEIVAGLEDKEVKNNRVEHSRWRWWWPMPRKISLSGPVPTRKVSSDLIQAKEEPKIVPPVPPKPNIKCTVRPTSTQLEKLNLNRGQNIITFSILSPTMGLQQVKASIYLWDLNTKIVISDIDGTITQSDLLGHILPTLGKDWSHSGVAQLYSNIYENGYKILYLSSRSIGQTNQTRQYLKSIRQPKLEKYPSLSGVDVSLPEGPVFTAPNGLFRSVHREVIQRRPQEFKIECLRDIAGLFIPKSIPEHESPYFYRPYYAGFGNRPTDFISYQSVGVPKGKIFTINKQGIITTRNKTYKKNYVKLNDLVNQMFPALNKPQQEEEFNDFQYWKTTTFSEEHLEEI